MEYTIHPMTADEAPEGEKIEKECFSSPWALDDILYHAGNRDSFFLTAKGNSGAVGYIGVIETAGEAYITNIAVLPGFRRKGIARLLLRSAISGSKGRGCEFITLEVRQNNAAAISLYESFGFAKEGIRKNFYSKPAEDAIIYTLRFNTEE